MMAFEHEKRFAQSGAPVIADTTPETRYLLCSRARETSKAHRANTQTHTHRWEKKSSPHEWGAIFVRAPDKNKYYVPSTYVRT